MAGARAPALAAAQPPPSARGAAVECGIAVNALAIEVAAATRFGEPLCVRHECEAIRGSGGFVMVPETRADCARAMGAKLIREIA